MSSLDRVNVKTLLTTIKQGLGPVLDRFTNELNDDLTRSCIVSKVDHFIRDLWHQEALYDFHIVCDTSNNKPSNINNNEMICDVFIQPNTSVDMIRIRTEIIGVSTDLFMFSKEEAYAAYEYAMLMLVSR